MRSSITTDRRVLGETVSNTLVLSNTLLTFTFLGVFVEVGICIYGVIRFDSRQVWLIPLLLSLFHAGYILARISAVKRLLWYAPELLSFSLLLLFVGVHTSSFIIAGSGLLTYSTVLQALRSGLKGQTKVSSHRKNLAKGLAMISASLAALPLHLLGVVIILATLLSMAAAWRVRGIPAKQKTTLTGKIRPGLLWFELLHHAHYFAYCYTFWVLLDRPFHDWIGFLFPIGWVGYWLLERKLREKSVYFSARMLMIGHLGCAVAVVAMLPSSNSLVILLLWFLTGIGGGTAYMLGNIPNAGDRELFEDFGHVIGCAGATLTIYLSGVVASSLILGAILAMIASLILVCQSRASSYGSV